MKDKLLSSREYELALLLDYDMQSGTQLQSRYVVHFGKSLPRGTVYTVLRRMGEARLVGSRPSADDRRERYYWLTSLGGRLRDATKKHLLERAQLAVESRT